jgi:dipeptidyl aminopeptidase/acylaminoacyl peptidase
MKSGTSLVLFAALWCGSAAAQMPPLVDRDLFFGEIEISGAQLSPDGRFISFVKPFKGTRNLWVKKADEPFSAAKPVTAQTKRPIQSYFWSRDSKNLLYVQDLDGDENFNVYGVNPSDPTADGGVPPARNLTDLKGVRVFLYSVPRVDPDVLYVGLNDRDKAWHDLYKLKISTGERTLMHKNTDRVVGWVFDTKGALRLATRVAENGDNEVLRVEDGKLVRIYQCDVLETCAPFRFDKESKKAFFVTNKGADVDLLQLTMLDPATGATELVESDPLKRVDMSNPIISDRTDELIATVYTDDQTRLYWRNKSYEADYKWLQGKLPNKELGFTSFTSDETRFLINARSDVEPGEVYLFDRKAKKLALQYKIREKLPRSALSPMKAIRYKSSDGLEIPAYLTLPKGLPEKDLPLVVFPHGGPWARDNWGYHPFAQFLSNRGYAVLQPNFRASTGFGKKFLNVGNREWGQKMQDDITWGVKHLVDRGTVNPKRVAIAGGSYGGYATLAGVAFTPELYAAGVPIVAPSNLITLLESIPPYWEAGRKTFAVRMGDLATPEGRKQLDRQSPLNSASKIKAPLLVVQGANDPRVNKRESDQIVIAVRDRGLPVEYLVAPDEGHGFAHPINNLAMVASMEKFLARHIDGRYQESMPADVAAKLKAITVDPKTVTLAKTADPSKVGAPVPATGLVTGLLEYKGTIEAGPQKVNIDISTEVKEEDGSWVVTNTMKTPAGPSIDSGWLDKKSLALRKRSVRQGPVSIDLTYTNDKVTGTMSMGGQSKPVAAETGGTLFGDVGTWQCLAALPLADGYTVTYRNFDIQRQKPKLLQMKVAGSDKVTVPAGTFDAYRLQVESADGGADKQTIWIAKDSRKPVKVQASLPQMGGATLTAELAK